MPRGTLVVRILLCCVTALATAAAAQPVVSVRVADGPWSHDHVATPLAGQRVDLKVAIAEGARIRWFELLPDLDVDHHNAEWPWNPGAYRWLGIERIACRRVEIEAWRDHAEVALPAGVPPPLPSSFVEARPELRHRDVGTFWLQVEVVTGSATQRTPGVESADDRGLPPGVLRISVRDGEGLPGWIATFFNVPSVFGSIPYQSRNWIGADCADVVMTARAAWLHEDLDRNWNVAGVVTTLRKRSETDLASGVATTRLAWGRDVHPGDVIAVRYGGGRQYQHVGVLQSDADADGILGPADLVLQAGPLPLMSSRLDGGAFDGHVVVMDPARR